MSSNMKTTSTSIANTLRGLEKDRLTELTIQAGGKVLNRCSDGRRKIVTADYLGQSTTNHIVIGTDTQRNDAIALGKYAEESRHFGNKLDCWILCFAPTGRKVEKRYVVPGYAIEQILKDVEAEEAENGGPTAGSTKMTSIPITKLAEFEVAV